MKIAHLILAHSQPGQLERLIKSLWHDQSYFFIHLDLKSSMEPFEYLRKENKVFFISNRVKVSWGTFSLVHATINGFEEILQDDNEYGFINLMSAQDYPLKSPGHIYDFLSHNKGKAFMHCLSVETEWTEAQIRLRKYDFGMFPFKGKYRLQAIWNAIMPARKMPAGLKPYGRSQWLTLPPDCVAYSLKFLKENPAIEKFFNYTWAADELIFQTILYNSPFRDRIVNDNLRYIDWSEGKTSPKTLTMADAKSLLTSPNLFARKFNEKVDREILDLVDSTIGERNNKQKTTGVTSPVTN